MLCIFDFEEAIYRDAGVPVEFVGHPLVDRARPRLTREEFWRGLDLPPETPTVALLPGSRPQEVSRILPTLIEAANRLALTRDIQFVVAVAPTVDASWVESILLEHYAGRATVIRLAGHATYDALAHCGPRGGRQRHRHDRSGPVRTAHGGGLPPFAAHLGIGQDPCSSSSLQHGQYPCR